MMMAQKAGIETSKEVSESTRKRNTMICEKNSTTTDRTERPVGDVSQSRARW